LPVARRAVASAAAINPGITLLIAHSKPKAAAPATENKFVTH